MDNKKLKAVPNAPETLEPSLFDQVLDGAIRSESDPEREVMSRINANLRAVIMAVGKWRAAGEVSITIKVLPDAAGNRVQFQVDTKSKVPTPPARTVVLYTDEDGGLHDDNPRQGNLFDG